VKILYLIPRLEPSGAAKQFSLLATGLPRERFELCVCALGRAGAIAPPLRTAGIQVEELGWHRAFDPGSLWRLGGLAKQFQPDVIHTWGPLALRVARMLPALRGYRLIVSFPFTPSERGPWAGRLERWLLQRAERVAIFGPRERDWALRCGVAEDRVVRLTPGVETKEAAPTKLGLPAQTRCIACIGPLHAGKGFRDAVWAFDILRYVVDNVHLLLIGDGPDRSHLERFVRDSQTTGLVHVLGPRDDVPALLARSEIVWVPSRVAAGVNAALEAQAAGLPVIATRLPELAEVVADGETGYLVPPGDKVALARQARLLLDNAALRGQMGEAGRRRAAERFPVAELVRRCAELYDAH
jgi:glycosyltransferase involved in cell wall biosynthesis